MKESSLANDLKSMVGDRVTTSEFGRWFYSSAWQSPPSPAISGSCVASSKSA